MITKENPSQEYKDLVDAYKVLHKELMFQLFII
mgnify:CR=1 FL=1